MEKIIVVGNDEIRMRASALVPRLYRFKFGRDMISDLNRLKKAVDKANNLPADATEEEINDAQLSALDLTIFENVSYMMAKHADKTIPDNPDVWLDSIDGVFAIYEILPQILELWSLNQKTTSVPKKK